MMDAVLLNDNMLQGLYCYGLHVLSTMILQPVSHLHLAQW